MSLYADDELGASVDLVDHPQIASSSAPTDPLQALAAALSLTAETPAQADALLAAGFRFEENPDRLPELCSQLLPMVVDGGESLLRSWTLDMIALAVGRSALQVDVKSHGALSVRGVVLTVVAQTSLDALERLLHTGSVSTIKTVISIFSTIHPILFRILATSRPPQAIYEAFRSSKSRILALALDPNAAPQSRGIKAAAWKFVQRVLLTGTRAPAADPRLRGPSGDVSISLVTRDSPLDPAELEEEAKMLQTQLVTQMFSSSDPAVLHSIFNICPVLCKSRPQLAALLVPSMAAWTPVALDAAGKPPMQVRAVEKTLRIVMTHLVKFSSLVSYHAQLNEAILRQRQRVEAAFASEVEERRARRHKVQDVKHPLEAETSAQGAKRARTQEPVLDVSSLPVDAVIEHVMSGLSSVSADRLQQAFEAARRAILDGSPDAIPSLAVSLGVSADTKDGVLNPLDMDLDDEDLLLAEPLADEDEDQAIAITEFTLPSPDALEQSERAELVSSALERICLSGDELAGLPDVDPRDGVAIAVQPKEAWMLLMARLATRGTDGKRDALAEYIAADFAARSKFAAVWLNEEWYSDMLNKTAHYPSHLDRVLTALISKQHDNRSLSSFLTSLPEIPPSVVGAIAGLCQDPDNGVVGFIALRELIETRPPVRQEALSRLLEMCTHADRKVRYPAIKTVNRWVQDAQKESPMAPQVIEYALSTMRRLVPGDQAPASPFLGPVTPETVQQHVELLFAISRRKQDLLEEIFKVYPLLEPPIAEQVETLLTPLIQSLGATARLLEVLRHFPQGADKLALHVVTTLSAGGASPVLVKLVKGLMGERELDPRFIIPIIGELDKGEIEKQIPRIVSLLGTSDSARDTVRTAFAAALQKLTPADLLVSLHEDESVRKATIEAIGICFAMTTVFRSDVLATALSRITDLPTLPIVFLRTTIQAVTTYKSLVPFIANNILPKLVSRKVWEQPPLWDGFVKLAKLIAPQSFGSLLQLPKEQLQDVLAKQPGLKPGFKTFLASKNQKAALAELFRDE